MTDPYGDGSAAPNADGSGPEGYLVNGNSDSMQYHLPGSGSYERARAEVWFLSEEHALAAGFSPSRGSRPAARGLSARCRRARSPGRARRRRRAAR